MNLDDNLAFMTWQARPDMSCEYVNRAWLDYTGYTLEQAVGEGWSRCLHPEDLARWLDACVRAFDARKPLEIEYRLRRRDGEYRWVSDRAAPRYTAEGLFAGYCGACLDIDGQMRERQSLSRALERERQLRVSTEESSRARHGLTVSVLQEAARALEAIERNARTQASMISNLLELTGDGPLLLGVRVLVVDRDCEDMVRVLEVAGADVRVAANTAEALRTLGAWRPDVLVSETNESFIRTLRALPAELGGCLRAAALTSDAGAAVAAGYDAQLARPVEPVALLATVARLAA